MAQQVWTSWPGGIGWPTPIAKGGKRSATRKNRKNRKATRKANRKTRTRRH